MTINRKFEMGDSGEYIILTVENEKRNSQTVIDPYKPYRWLHISTDGVEIEVEVIDGMEKLKTNNIVPISYDGIVVLSIGGEHVEMEITNGTITRTIDTDGPIEVQAIELEDKPTEPSNTVIIEP